MSQANPKVSVATPTELTNRIATGYYKASRSAVQFAKSALKESPDITLHENMVEIAMRIKETNQFVASMPDSRERVSYIIDAAKVFTDFEIEHEIFFDGEWFDAIDRYCFMLQEHTPDRSALKKVVESAIGHAFAMNGRPVGQYQL